LFKTSDTDVWSEFNDDYSGKIIWKSPINNKKYTFYVKSGVIFVGNTRQYIVTSERDGIHMIVKINPNDVNMYITIYLSLLYCGQRRKDPDEPTFPVAEPIFMSAAQTTLSNNSRRSNGVSQSLLRMVLGSPGMYVKIADERSYNPALVEIARHFKNENLVQNRLPRLSSTYTEKQLIEDVQRRLRAVKRKSTEWSQNARSMYTALTNKRIKKHNTMSSIIGAEGYRSSEIRPGDWAPKK